MALKKKREYNYVSENVSVVRDTFSKYLGVSQQQPVVITERNRPKSVLISYTDFVKKYSHLKKKEASKEITSKDKKYTKFSDFIGIGNKSGRKIDINEEIEKGWIGE